MKLAMMWMTVVVVAVAPAMAVDTAKKAAPAKKAPVAAKSQAKAVAAAAKPTAVAAKPAVAPTAAPMLPVGAVEVEPGLYKHTAANGTVWMYRRTPFGYSRYEPEKEVRDSDREESQHLVATDKGETVQFERKTPFGVNKWSRRKGDLSGAERLALERAQQGGTSRSADKASQE